MSTSDETPLYETTGPEVSLSNEEADIVEGVVDAINVDERMDDDDLLERARNVSYQASLFDDEIPSGTLGRLRRKHGLPRMSLPGFGSTREDCGVDIPHACKGCGHTFTIGRTCKQSRCPRCGAQWVVKRARNHVAALDEAARMMASRDDVDGAVYKHHLALSPPDDWMLDVRDGKDVLNKTFHAIRDILNAIGAEGMVYYHPYRGKSEGDGPKEAHLDDRGEWKKRVFSDRDWEDDVADELELSPHFHVVAVSPHIPGGDVTTAIYEQTGWVMHRITERNGSPVSLGDLGSVARAVTYCLSHTAIDTSGDRDVAQMRRYGRAINDCQMRDSTKTEARRAVAWAAPTTLGIPTGEIECRAQVDKDEREDGKLDDLHDDCDGDGDGDDEGDMVACKGEIIDIDDADELLEDPEWVRRARYADQLLEAWEEWQDAGGWKGWLEKHGPPD